MSDPVQTKEDIARLKIHFAYVTIILIAAIVLLATYNWTGIKGFTDYLTAAGTMVSIVLGVLAIIYAFVSGDSISKSLGNVASAATDLQAAKKDFASVAEAASGLNEASRKSAAELTGVLELVQREVQELKTASENLHKSTDEIANTVGQMPERLDKIDSRLQESLKTSKGTVPSEPDVPKAPLTIKILKRASYYGKAVMYASALSKETGRHFSLSEGVFAKADEYCYGTFLCLYSAGILEHEALDRDERTFKVKEFPLSSSDVKKEICSTKRYGAKPAQLDRMFKDVEAMFSPPVPPVLEISS